MKATPKPSLGQGILVILGILALYMLVMCIEPIVGAFLMWLDKLPVGERRFVLLTVPLGLVTGLWIRRLRGGGR